MKQEKIIAIIKEEVEDIVVICEVINTNFDKEAIHRFRVAVKTLRSFLRLQRLSTRNPKLKIPKKVKRLYYIAGAIREIQLEIERFSKEETDLPHYLLKLQSDLEQQKKEWEQHYSKGILLKLDNKLAAFKYKKIHPYILEKFFNNRMADIAAIGVKTAPSDTQVHMVRKHIKDILYNAKIAGKKWDAARKQIEKIPIKKLDYLADMIGDYNDERITLGHLNNFSSLRLEKKEKSALTKLKNKESQKLRVDKKTILTATKNYTSKRYPEN